MNVRTSVERAAGNAVRSALSFAHLSGIGASKAAEDEDKKDEKDKDAKARRAEDEDDKKDKDARAADDKDEQDRSNGDSKASDDSDDDGEDKDKKSKKARADDDDKESEDDEDDKKKEATEDDDEEEMRGKSAAAQARRRERARCASIFAEKAAGKNPQLAAQLAFQTSLTRQEAITVLRATPAPASNSGRAANNPRLGPGGQAEVGGGQAIQSRWDRAFTKAGAADRRKS